MGGMGVSSSTPGSGTGMPTFDELVATPSPVRRQLEALRQEGATGMAAAAQAAHTAATEGVVFADGGVGGGGLYVGWSSTGLDDGAGYPAAHVAVGAADSWGGGCSACSAEHGARSGGRTSSLISRFSRSRERERERGRRARRPRQGNSAGGAHSRSGARTEELDEDLEWTLRSSSAFAGVENLV
ncbi:hypothetical protein MMPV_004776 [Pyropia vietnamensis]